MVKAARLMKLTLIGLLVFLISLSGFSYYALKRVLSRRSATRKGVLRRETWGKWFFKSVGAQTVSFRSSDGIDLVGKYVPAQGQAQGTIIFCHGFQRNKERMAHYSGLFGKYNQFFFDFRASGESGGLYSSIGGYEYRDVIAAVHQARKLSGARPIFIFGISMGASAAIKAVKKHPRLVDGLILDSAYANLQDVMTDVFNVMTGLPHFPFLPIMRLMFWALLGSEALEMVPEKEAAELGMPAFFIHSATDNFTNAHHSVRLFGSASQGSDKARIWIAPPARHGFLFETYTNYYRYKVEKFLRKARIWLREALSRDVVWHPADITQ